MDETLFKSLFVKRVLERVADDPLIKNPEEYLESWINTEGYPSIHVIAGELGAGKTWFIRNIVFKLRGRGVKVLHLDVAQATQETLWGELMISLNRWRSESGLGPSINDPPTDSKFKSAWVSLVGELNTRDLAKQVVLVVDGMDSLSFEIRESIETNLILAFFDQKLAKAKAIIAYRRDQTIIAPKLSWNVETFNLRKLEDLASGEEQVDKLCAALNIIKGELVARTGRETPDATYIDLLSQIFLTNPGPNPFQAEEVARMSADTIDNIGRSLKENGYIYPNPYVNSRAMAQALARGDGELASADFDQVLRHYLERSSIEDLSEQIRLLEAVVETVKEHGDREVKLQKIKETLRVDRLSSDESKLLERLIGAGLVLINVDGQYSPDPSCVLLCNHRNAARAAGR